jgi:hypothetical protein
MLGLSLSDPAVLARFRDAAVDLLTHPVFEEAPRSGKAPGLQKAPGFNEPR